MRVATAAGLPNSATYNTGTLAYTAGANAALVVDGVTLAVNDRVLVKDQANVGSNRNGIYVVTTAGSGSVPWVITRATDADTSAEILPGMRVRATEGTVNGQTEWALATTGVITLDTTVLSFIQTGFAAAWLPVRVATAAALGQSAVYANKAYGALSNAALVIDGVTLAVGDRVLVKDQGDSTNGIYVVVGAGSAGSLWTMRRATDAFVSQQFLSGMSVRVAEGTVNGAGQFYLATTGAITLDTTTLTFGGSFGGYRRGVKGGGTYIAPIGFAAPTGNNSAQNLLRYSPIDIERSVTADRIGVNVSTAAGSSTVRLGIYNDSNGKPGTLLLDAGTVVSTSTGAKEITISQALPAGRYWLASVAQGAAVGLYSAVGDAASYSNTSISQFLISEYQDTGTISGSLPGTATTTDGTSNAIRQFLRIA